MHIEENMFISKTLFSQDPLSVGDPHRDLPLAHHLQVGVDVDITPPHPHPPSPCPISISFVFICWQDEDRLPTNISTRQFAGITVTR